MRILALIATLIVVAVSGLSASAEQQQQWAAIDPNNEYSSPVVWGETEARARQAAIDACKRVSRTCATSPASTGNLDDIFATMCCERPRLGCAIGVGTTQQAAVEMVRETFSKAGYSDCAPARYLSARTGTKQ